MEVRAPRPPQPLRGCGHRTVSSALFKLVKMQSCRLAGRAGRGLCQPGCLVFPLALSLACRMGPGTPAPAVAPGEFPVGAAPALSILIILVKQQRLMLSLSVGCCIFPVQRAPLTYCILAGVHSATGRVAGRDVETLKLYAGRGMKMINSATARPGSL